MFDNEHIVWKIRTLSIVQSCNFIAIFVFRELTFRKGDIIFVKRQIDKNWYEGEHNAMVGLFPINYVEVIRGIFTMTKTMDYSSRMYTFLNKKSISITQIIPYDEIRTLPKRPSEGQARAKFNFVAQTNLELSLVKGTYVISELYLHSSYL